MGFSVQINVRSKDPDKSTNNKQIEVERKYIIILFWVSFYFLSKNAWIMCAIYRPKWMKLFSLTFKTRFIGLSFRRCAKPDFHHSSLFAFPCAFIQHVRFVSLVSSSSKIAKQIICDLTTTPSCVQGKTFKKT